MSAATSLIIGYGFTILLYGGYWFFHWRELRQLQARLAARKAK